MPFLRFHRQEFIDFALQVISYTNISYYRTKRALPSITRRLKFHYEFYFLVETQLNQSGSRDYYVTYNNVSLLFSLGHSLCSSRWF